MKYLLLTLLGLVLYSSCGESEATRSPEKTCEEFCNKLADKEYDAAKKYTSGATDQYLDLLKKGMDIFKEMNQAGNNFKALADVDDKEALSYKCATEANKATCKCTHKSNPALSYNFNLVQENGQWVIHQPKETIAD